MVYDVKLNQPNKVNSFPPTNHVYFLKVLNLNRAEQHVAWDIWLIRQGVASVHTAGLLSIALAATDVDPNVVGKSYEK